MDCNFLSYLFRPENMYLVKIFLNQTSTAPSLFSEKVKCIVNICTEVRENIHKKLSGSFYKKESSNFQRTVSRKITKKIHPISCQRKGHWNMCSRNNSGFHSRSNFNFRHNYKNFKLNKTKSPLLNLLLCDLSNINYRIYMTQPTVRVIQIKYDFIYLL